MKLHELSTPRQSQQFEKVFESYFGKNIRLKNVNLKEARAILYRVKHLLSEHRKNRQEFYTSQNNPSYLKLLVLEQTLSAHISEMTPPGNMVAVDVNDPKTKAAMDKAGRGQTLNPDEQKLVNAVAMMKKEAAKMKRPVTESEVQQAQVVLAAQDMVDSIQDMIEDATEMQYKELPALVDQVRNQIGGDQATQFGADANTALQNLVQSLQGTKQQLETALGVVTGQAAPPVPGDMGAPDLGNGELAGVGADNVDGGPMPDEEEEIQSDELEVDDIKPSTKTLGRERRK